MPVRKVQQHGKNVIGLFPSIKLKRMVAYESLVEWDVFFVYDYDLAVTFFEEQPRALEYIYQGKRHTYTPDVWVVRGSRNSLVECKPEAFVDSAENQIKFAAAREWCAGCGWEFEVVVAEELRAGFRLRNIKTMTLYARHRVPDAFRSKVRACLREGAMPISELNRQVREGHEAVFGWLLCMAFHHEIEIAVDEAPIDEQSLVWPGGAV